MAHDCVKSIVHKSMKKPFHKHFVQFSVLGSVEILIRVMHSSIRPFPTRLNSLAKVRSWIEALPERILANWRCANCFTRDTSRVSNRILRIGII